MTDKLGARASHQALVASDQAASRLDPLGFDPSRLAKAIALATQAHAAQIDKGGKPYILHPLRVMFAVEKHGEDAMIAGVLHDTVEDCGLELRLIRHRFGSAVAEAVDALTRREGESYGDFIERCGQNDIALVVKKEDLSHNSDLGRLREINAEDWSRVQKYSRAFERLSAIAMEARQRRDAEERPDPKDDSAGRRHRPDTPSPQTPQGGDS